MYRIIEAIEEKLQETEIRLKNYEISSLQETITRLEEELNQKGIE